MFVNYRGYGGSTGAPSEKALVSDALAVWDWARAEHSEVAVVGRSLGSSVAVQLAAARSVSLVVLVTPFDSLVRRRTECAAVATGLVAGKRSL